MKTRLHRSLNLPATLLVASATCMTGIASAQTVWSPGAGGSASFGNSTAVLSTGFVLIGDPGFTNTNGQVGTVGMYAPGSANAIKNFDGSAAGSRRGDWVCQLGKVNADSVDDFAVSEPGANKVYVYSGVSPYSPIYAAPLTPPAIPGVTVTNFGHRVTSLGDLNSDGFDDIAVSCNTSSAGPGYVFIYTSQSAFSTTLAYWLTVSNGSGASHNSNQFGHDLAYEPSTKKLLVGAPYYTTSNDPAQGAVVEYTLTPSTPKPSATIRQLPSPGNLDKFGYGVTFIEDTDNDNQAEWASGAEFRWNAGPNTVGQVAIFHTASATYTTYGAANNLQTRIGAHIRAVDDLDGDGYRDLVTSDIGGTLHAVSGGLSNHTHIARAPGWRLAPISVGANIINTGGWGGTSVTSAKIGVAQAGMVHLAGGMNRQGACASSGAAPSLGITRPLEGTIMTIEVNSTNALHQSQAGILQIATTNPLPYNASPWPFCSGSYFTNGGLMVPFTTDAAGKYPQNFSVPLSSLGMSLPVQAVVNNSATGSPDLTNVIFITIGDQ